MVRDNKMRFNVKKIASPKLGDLGAVDNMVESTLLELLALLK